MDVEAEAHQRPFGGPGRLGAVGIGRLEQHLPLEDQLDQRGGVLEGHHRDAGKAARRPSGECPDHGRGSSDRNADQLAAGARRRRGRLGECAPRRPRRALRGGSVHMGYALQAAARPSQPQRDLPQRRKRRRDPELRADRLPWRLRNGLGVAQREVPGHQPHRCLRSPQNRAARAIALPAERSDPPAAVSRIRRATSLIVARRLASRSGQPARRRVRSLDSARVSSEPFPPAPREPPRLRTRNHRRDPSPL